MKIMIFGAGVIGTTYAWQLSEAGHNITLLVRSGKKEAIYNNGIKINCLDCRNKQKKQTKALFKPSVVECFSPQDGYEIIIVAVNRHQLNDILPILAENAGNSTIIFFQNNWSGADEIERYLNASQYLFGFPSMVGGGKSEDSINPIIFDDNTKLGEKDGKKTDKINLFESILQEAGMNPKIIDNMIPWLMTHYLQQSSGIGAFLKATSFQHFIKNSTIIKEWCLAYREGLKVCRARGVNTFTIFPANLYYLPTFLTVPLIKKIFGTPEVQEMIEGHMKHGYNEWIIGYYEVLAEGKKLGISMPYWQGFKKYVDMYKY